MKAAEILGVERKTLSLQDRLISDTIEARLQVARLLREHRPQMVFATAGAGVHPDHKALTEIVTNGVFYARLPKWDEIAGGEALRDTEPHEIQRLFFGHCRMEPAWDRFDFAVDVSDVYDLKTAALRVYESVFSGASDSARQVRCRGSLRRQPCRRAICRGISLAEPVVSGWSGSLFEGTIWLTCFLRAPFADRQLSFLQPRAGG